MPFEPGHKYGYHNNHYKGGRLTKEQLAELKALVPKSIEVWRKILELPVTLKGASVQSETAAKVLSKFVADLTEAEIKTDYSDGVKEFLTDISTRISGLGSKTGTPPSEPNQVSDKPATN